MKIFKKVYSIIIVVSILTSLVACSDTSWVYKYENKSIPSGLYLSFLINAYSEAVDKISEELKKEEKTLKSQEEIFTHKLEDKDAEVWIKEKAQTLSIQYFVVEKLFFDLGLSLSENDLSRIDYTLNSVWTNYSELYEPNGASKNSVKLYLENSLKKELVFNKYYGKDGIEETPQEQVDKYLVENYALVKYILFPLSDSSNQPLTDEAKTKLKESTQDYLKRLNNGEDIDKLIAEHKKNQNPNATPESDPKANFVVIPKIDSQFPEKLVSGVFNLEFEKPSIIEDDNYHFVINRYDISKNEETMASYKESALYQLKEPDFKKKIEDLEKNINFEKNQNAINRYSPKNIKEPKK